MGLEEYKGVYIYAQQVDNKLSDIAFELVGKAKELAADLNTEVTAVLLGSNVKALATELGEYGADNPAAPIGQTPSVPSGRKYRHSGNKRCRG